MEVGYKSRWWARCNHVCNKFGLWRICYGLGIFFDYAWHEMCGRRLLWQESRSIAGDSGGMVSA